MNPVFGEFNVFWRFYRSLGASIFWRFYRSFERVSRTIRTSLKDLPGGSSALVEDRERPRTCAGRITADNRHPIADGTHIAIRAPELSKEDAYVCRKGVGQHSINVQAVCDHNMKFLNVDCTWPGSTHDSFVMQNSAVWDAFESGRLKGIILGDSGYPLKKWLMTPLTEPKTNAERRYQAAHTSTRSTIERSFGLLKRRFSCLHSGLRMDLKNVPNIIGACFLLHNIARDMNLPDFADVDVSEIVPDTRLSQPDDSSYPKRFRDELIQNCFSNS